MYYPLYSIFYTSFYDLYNFIVDKKDILNKNTYLNYFGNSFSDGYINFIPRNEFIPPTFINIFYLI